MSRRVYNVINCSGHLTNYVKGERRFVLMASSRFRAIVSGGVEKYFLITCSRVGWSARLLNWLQRIIQRAQNFIIRLVTEASPKSSRLRFAIESTKRFLESKKQFSKGILPKETTEHSFPFSVSSTCANSEKLRPSGMLEAGTRREQAAKKPSKSPWRRLAGAVDSFRFSPSSGEPRDMWHKRMAKNLFRCSFRLFHASPSIFFRETNTFWFLLCKQTQDTKNRLYWTHDFISTNKQREAQKGT